MEDFCRCRGRKRVLRYATVRQQQSAQNDKPGDLEEATFQ
jgi:hypothetical protein